MNPYEYVREFSAKKTTTSQESIENAILSLLDEKELYKLSVKEICKKANVARSTFYAYYDGVDDCVEEIIGNIDLSFFEETVSHIKHNQKLLYLFMIKRYNNRFVCKWKDAIKYHLYQRMPEDIGDNNKELTLEIIASQAIGAYQYWLQNPYELDIDYVKKLLRKTIETYTE